LQALTTSFTVLKSKIVKRTIDAAGAPDTSSGFCSEIKVSYFEKHAPGELVQGAPFLFVVSWNWL
jgi:hypothetical protein